MKLESGLLLFNIKLNYSFRRYVFRAFKLNPNHFIKTEFKKVSFKIKEK